jgi:hypothetical protein
MRWITSERRDVKSKLREALKAGSPKRVAPNINCTGKSCGKLKARKFSLRQDEVFSRQMRGGEQFREKRSRHDFAENTPSICHRAVRLAGRG